MERLQQLRDTLGSPNYITTLSRLGYLYSCIAYLINVSNEHRLFRQSFSENIFTEGRAI
jgi:hypothetical protein